MSVPILDATLDAHAQAPPRTCGNEEVPPELRARLQAAYEATIAQRGHFEVGGIIRTAFHVITDGSDGALTDDEIREQIAVLNATYAATGFVFLLVSIDRTDDADWFTMDRGSQEELDAKQALAIDPANTMNVYTANTGLLGWATFPDQYAENDLRHGLVIRFSSLPGGEPPYDLGYTATHEAGHYLGLYHTFSGGCEEPGDEVDDTPYEAYEAYGCELGRDTCPDDPGDDPVTNYMDYSDDPCMNNFTPLQDERMDALVTWFRPSLLEPATFVDWRNNGTEDGSFGHPYNTVAEGVQAAPTGGTVVIASGNYVQNVTVTRAMTLMVASGSVRVGS